MSTPDGRQPKTKMASVTAGSSAISGLQSEEPRPIFAVDDVGGGVEGGGAEQHDGQILENESSKREARDRPDPSTGGDSASGSKEANSDARDASAGEGGGLIARTAREFTTKTVQVCAEHYARVAAHLAGVGPEFEICVFIYRVWEWTQTLQGDGGVEVTAPLPLGPGVDFDVSLRIGGDGDELPLAMYLGPTEDPPVGVLVFGPLTVEPTPDHRDHKRGEHEPPQDLKVSPRADEEPNHRDGQLDTGVVEISVDLSSMLPAAGPVVTDEDHEASAAVVPPGDESLRAELWERRQILLNEGVDLIFGYDPKTRRAVLVHVSDENRPPRRVFIGLDGLGHLSINVIDATYTCPEVG